VGPAPSTERPGRRPGAAADASSTTGEPTFVVAATVTTPLIDNESFKVQPPVISSAGNVTKSDVTSPAAGQVVSPISGGDAPGRTSATSSKTTSKTTPQQPPQVIAGGSTSPTSVTATKRPASVENIPQFYFPTGAPSTSTTAVSDVGDPVLRKVKEEFEKVEGGKVTKSQVGPIVKVILTVYAFHLFSSRKL